MKHSNLRTMHNPACFSSIRSANVMVPRSSEGHR
jgi:hypothetical protein